MACPESWSDPPIKVDAPGLPNVFRVTERLYSGGSPEGDEGFAALQKLGVNALGLSGVDGRLMEAHRKEAIRMIVSGFFQQVFDRITVESVRHALGEAIGRRVREFE